MKLTNRGREDVSLRVPLPIEQVNCSSVIDSIAAEVVAFAAGAAGTTGDFVLSHAPISSLKGDRVGTKSDSSLVFTATAVITEVAFSTVLSRYSNAFGTLPDADPPTDFTTYLTNGEYYVVYETGRIYYKKADASVAGTVAYKIRKGDSGVTVETGDLEIGAVEIKNATDDTRATVGAKGLYVDPQVPGTPGEGSKNVAVAGTPERLVAATTPCKTVLIVAKETNTGVIVVGSSGIDALSASLLGIPLLPGDSLSMDVDNLYSLYVDAAVNTNGVVFSYLS